METIGENEERIDTFPSKYSVFNLSLKGYMFNVVSYRTSILGIETRLVINKILWDLSFRVCSTSESEKFFRVFANPGLNVMAGNIVPYNTIIVEIIEDGNASFISASLAELTVIGLGCTTTTSARPVTSPSLGAVGGCDSGRGSRPEPSVDKGRLKIRTVTSIEVALATRGPDVFDIALCNLTVYKLCFILSLETHQILTMFSADVSCVQPVPLV